MQGGLAACSTQNWWWCDLWRGRWQHSGHAGKQTACWSGWLKYTPYAPLKSSRIFFLLSGRL
jgi:hypothetical protein